MEPICLNPTETTPEVVFDKKAGIFKITGRSFPEDSLTFYKPLLNWLMEYSEDANDPTVLEVQLEYFNSGSLKQVFKLLYVIEDIMELGKESKVIWHYKKNDELMLQKGQEFQKFLEVPVELVEH
ncbi:MAG: DUF1987 domain-containing protein [Crocinitomicaceae bacterium]|nr:DUF1987 domain-containing protein [Crocinitomicaceae bacterium]